MTKLQPPEHRLKLQKLVSKLL